MSGHGLVAAGYELGVGRTVPSLAAVVGLVSVVLAVAALLRRRRAAAVAALVLGPVSALVGAVHGANAAGGLGTGNGLAGAVIAVLVGLIGTGLGGLAVVRARRRDRDGRVAGR